MMILNNTYSSVFIGLILLSYSVISHAMQPVNAEGVQVSSAYFNSNIDVISETINMDVSEHFRKASHTVQYEIYNNQAGAQIPLFFNLHRGTRSVEYPTTNADINITVNGSPITVKNKENSVSKALFVNFFKSYIKEPDLRDLDIYDSKNYTNNLLDYVSFIETDLEVGYHTIIASYDVMPSYRDRSGITYEYSYDYRFIPIKLKQGSTNTSIHLNFDGITENVNVETFDDNYEKFTGIADDVLTFKKPLPDMVSYTYKRQFSGLVKVLVKGPFLGFFILFCVLAARWHIREIKKSSDLKFSSIIGYILIASLFIPFISIVSYTLYEFLVYTVIDAEIIDDMSTFFGTIAYFVLLLILAPFYAVFIYSKYYK